MDRHVHDFFQMSADGAPNGHFHKVIALHEAPDIDCETLCQLVPDLSKGWYELAILNTKDRIEFTRDYWLDKLPYRKGVNEFINTFFAGLDDIGIFITQKKFDDPFEASIIYSLKGNRGFYRGGSAASEEQIAEAQRLFPDYILPADYRAFLMIHNGFWKTTDCTGVTRVGQLGDLYNRLQNHFSEGMRVQTSDGDPVNPKTLIPFYESFGMPFFQCFWGEWYPESEMGNVYFSGETNTVLFAEGGNSKTENMAFPTFLDWLLFYLEQVT